MAHTTTRYRLQDSEGETVSSTFTREDAEQAVKVYEAQGYDVSEWRIVEVQGPDNRW